MISHIAIPQSQVLFGFVPKESLKVFDWIQSIIERLEAVVNYIFERLPYNALNRLIIYLIILFFVALMVLLPSIAFLKVYISYRDRKYAHLYKKYSNDVIQYLMNALEDKDMEELKNRKSRFHRRVMVDVLMAIDKAENKEVSDKIRKLYKDIKLDADSRRKVQKRAWYKRIRGIRELSHMREKSENQRILDFLNNKNEVLRIESQIGLIKLLPFVPFAFLDSQEKPFTVWEQINVFDLIRKKRIEIPEFHLWLDHWNDSVVMFCLDMIRILKQKEATPKVLELVNHDNDRVKGKVIKTLVELENIDAVALLKEMYLLEELPNKLNILKSIGQLRLEGEIGFLKKELKNPEFKIRMECCKSIALLGAWGEKRLREIELEADETLKKIINHVLDPRL
ncbi:HEAT repeat domain-containing protein [Ancylomarina longa]|uniref:HEAT repeat domain-containing protein n=1 Tax=Ancylomarina longa TaxID=2487017 RepID=UPI000FCB6C00|nr:hypothetical protein [Ancylomarina longa]